MNKERVMIENDRLIVKMCSKYSFRSDWEDLLQEVRLKVFKALDNYKNNCKLSTFIANKANWAAMGYIRDCEGGRICSKFKENYNVINNSLSLDVEYNDGTGDAQTLKNFFKIEPDHTPEIIMMLNSLLTRAELEIATLTVEGYTQTEIAEERGVTQIAIGRALRIIRNKLKSL